MFPNPTASILLGVLVLSAGCRDDSPAVAPAQASSTRAGVKPKAPDTYARDLASSLALPLDALCLEFSTIDCIEAHRIALGGVAPYDAAIYEPMAEPGVSSPIAVDRIALSACGERIAREFSGDDVGLIAELVAGDTSEGARQAVATRMFRRLLRRDGEPHELRAVVELWNELPEPTGPAWAQLSCFAVATTLENLFY